jgi:hypothetical protein
VRAEMPSHAGGPDAVACPGTRACRRALSYGLIRCFTLRGQPVSAYPTGAGSASPMLDLHH